ncbi:MAG: hypothetical protein IKO03_10060 [Lachnospiraceae bacterium]|nr:hypothetical protein [Lachnospiraceae bacterium]MBR3509092.1 hypothetical protein [Lachnospiraceae bacterium]
MSNIAGYVIILLILAVIIILVGVLAYNKRLDKITRGEAHDTHTRIPEPGTTAGVTYKTVLIALMIIAVLSISSLLGHISAMKNQITSLQSQVHTMSMDVIELKNDLAQSDSLVTDLAWEITGQDMEKKTADLKFTLGLKQYSDDTKVTIALKNHEIPLTKTAPGTFSGQLTTNIFESYEQLKICITEGTITTVETSDFYQYLFWDLLPVNMLECNLDSKDLREKTKCNGWYRLIYDHPEMLQKVTITYLVDGEEYKTFDATSMAKEGAQIDLDKDVIIKKDLVLVVETLSTDGYKIVKKNPLVYRTPSDYLEDGYERIYDAAGNLVWENEKYN